MYPIKLQKTGMLTIQKVTVADCELINKMAGEVFPATYKEILSPEQLDYMMDWMYAPENIRKQMEEIGPGTVSGRNGQYGCVSAIPYPDHP